MNLTIEEAVSFLRENDNYLILTHTRPDGDTLGSASALCAALRALGKTAYIYNNPQVTPRYFKYISAHLAPEIFAPENFTGTVVSVDTATEKMLAPGANSFAGHISLAIDHHASNTGYAAKTLLDPKLAACGELILKIVTELGSELTPEIAEAIYVAISTDTGCFSYSNTTADSLRAAAVCVEKGINIEQLNRELFRTKTRARIGIEAYLFSDITYTADDKAAVACIPEAVISSLGAVEDDLENIAALPAGIDGIIVAATLRDIDNGQRVKVSLRSTEAFDSNVFCQKYGGGGHAAAAGFTTKSSLTAIRDNLLRSFEEEITGYGN